MRPASSQQGKRGKKKRENIVRYSVDNLPIDTKTDWARFDAIRDEDIDCSDIPELDDNFWKNAKLMPPLIPGRRGKHPVSLRLDDDIIRWFKLRGPRYQSRINAVLRAYVETHRSD